MPRHLIEKLLFIVVKMWSKCGQKGDVTKITFEYLKENMCLFILICIPTLKLKQLCLSLHECTTVLKMIHSIDGGVSSVSS